MAALQNHASEVAEVPGEYGCVPGVSHCHDGQVGEVGAGIDILFAEVERQFQLRFGWRVKPVDAAE